ncbi:hypothetical protein ABGV42_00080 [Paenibacillus pabuli]|uniref:hypothetical protein n=1 Tax=Paenibacillus pabuli TaxID=1472 RepID=UPI0032423310
MADRYYIGIFTTDNGMRFGMDTQEEVFGRIYIDGLTKDDAEIQLKRVSEEVGLPIFDKDTDIYVSNDAPLDYVGICKTDKGFRVGISEDKEDFVHVIDGPLNFMDAYNIVIMVSEQRKIPIYNTENWLTGS